jgi:hypothetical protein
MKRLAAVLLLALAWISAHAEPVLLGKWKSNHELTMRFARERAKMEDKTLLFFGQMMGRMTLDFTSSLVSSDMPDWQSETVSGVKSNLSGFHESHRYEVLGSTADQVAVDSVEPVSGRRKITVYNFEDDDTMWIYLGGGTFPQMNVREYFVRIQ